MPVEQNEKTIVLTTESGSSATIHYFGSHITSWKQGGKERLFMSSKSPMDEVKPMRGGIPIVFPIFGPPPSSPPEYASLSQHGYVRTQTWTLEKIIMDRSEGVSIRLSAPAPPSTFNHTYKLAYVVTLTAHQLSTDLHVTNTGKEDFIFQALLHTYLAVPDVSKISIKGIGKGVEFRDKTKGGEVGVWDGGDLRIDKETDRVNMKVPSQELTVDDGQGSGFTVRFRGFEDCVTWNPSQTKGSQMADMEDGGWERYVCVEPGYVREFKTLRPGEEFLGQQVLSVI